MKKNAVSIFMAVIALAMVFVLAGCPGNKKADAGKSAETASTAATAADQQSTAVVAGEQPPAKPRTPVQLEPIDKVKARLKPGLYTVIDTDLGRIVCELYPKVAPLGVANFVGLAEGTKEFTDPATGQKAKKPFYDGLIFHRVIPDFMIQGGDPLGQGMGGPGYQFKNEISPDYKFDQPGRLAYANAGPDTNGSQFFITTVPNPSLDGGYTIFGQVVEGQEVAVAIAAVPRGASQQDMPNEPVAMKKVSILRIGKEAEAYKAK